ncbi:uncharacterized protein V6R79_001815 [Siganus canaliculatus]
MSSHHLHLHHHEHGFHHVLQDSSVTNMAAADFPHLRRATARPPLTSRRSLSEGRRLLLLWFVSV